MGFFAAHVAGRDIDLLPFDQLEPVGVVIDLPQQPGGVRRHDGRVALPATAVLFTEDYPARAERLPRALSEQVPVVLAHRGQERVELHALIVAQQARVADAPVLFPRPTKNPDRRAPIAAPTYRGALYRWLASCEIRDPHGQPVRLTPHQWRHTLGTRFQPGRPPRGRATHPRPRLTADDRALRPTARHHRAQALGAARKVDITGQSVTVDPDGPLAEAAWAKQRLGRVTQALPNGFCGLPVQKTCPHANACLTCPMFVTTAEFLPQDRTHRQQVHQIITAAEARGQTRLVEMNQQVLDNLDRVITGLADGPSTDDPEVCDAG